MPIHRHRRFLQRWGTLGCLALMSHSLAWANDDMDFFSLPSPNEILNEAESMGLKVTLAPKNVAILKLDLEKLAKTNPEKATFIMGRIFSVAGYGLKDLNNNVILQLAQKVLSSAQALDLPPVIKEEIDRFYRLMMEKNVWERQELLLSFTSARASLMYLLKGSSKVEEKDQARLARYGAALECGLWYQSLELATDHLGEDQMEAFKEVYMDPDYLTYFEKILKRSQTGDQKELFVKLYSVNAICIKALEDDKIEPSEIELLKTALKEVMNND
jgi:hypothetical protein